MHHPDEIEKLRSNNPTAEKLKKSTGFGISSPDYFSSAKKRLSSTANLLVVSNTKPPSTEDKTEPMFGSSLKLQSPVKAMSGFPSEAEQLLVIAPKKMTFMQVDEIVNELIESKLQSDVNHLANRLPKKTMEGHLNEIFMNKFGVRKVVLEYIQSFIYHLKYYSYRNSKFRAFNHILRNECEEEYIQAHKTVEKTLAFLLKVDWP